MCSHAYSHRPTAVVDVHIPWRVMQLLSDVIKKFFISGLIHLEYGHLLNEIDLGLLNILLSQRVTSIG